MNEFVRKIQFRIAQEVGLDAHKTTAVEDTLKDTRRAQPPSRNQSGALVLPLALSIPLRFSPYYYLVVEDTFVWDERIEEGRRWRTNNVRRVKEFDRDGRKRVVGEAGSGSW